MSDDNKLDLHARPYLNEVIKGKLCVFDGRPVNMSGCTFVDCKFALVGQAANTLGFLEGLYNMGPQGQALVEELFQMVRDKAAAQPSRGANAYH